jgi:hypothetical protein
MMREVTVTNHARRGLFKRRTRMPCKGRGGGRRSASRGVGRGRGKTFRKRLARLKRAERKGKITNAIALAKYQTKKYGALKKK